MGFLRLLFALSVVSYHSEPNGAMILFNPFTAVNSFLVISGFYIAFILDGKYKSVVKFYITRFLRIFPLYWLALFLTICLGLGKIFLNIGSGENAITHYFLYSSHLKGFEAIIEGINFILRNLTLIITKDYFGVSKNQASGFLIINQSWTLQIELLFYLLAPFLLAIKKNFFFFFGVYFIVVYSIIVPFGFFPEWSLTMSFIKYLFYFLLGISSYRYIYKNIQNYDYGKLPIIALAGLIIFILCYQLLPWKFASGGFEEGLLYFIPFALIIPFIFNFSKNNSVDRYIGELSYPVYITHMIFVKVYFSLFSSSLLFVNTLIISIVTILASVLLVKFVQNPIDRLRYKIANPKP